MADKSLIGKTAEVLSLSSFVILVLIYIVIRAVDSDNVIPLCLALHYWKLASIDIAIIHLTWYLLLFLLLFGIWKTIVFAIKTNVKHSIIVLLVLFLSAPMYRYVQCATDMIAFPGESHTTTFYTVFKEHPWGYIIPEFFFFITCLMAIFFGLKKRKVITT